jgi:DNA-binding transcriptional MerR regulator/methylmalonyl-CoA mutase cobalamin-binding subunit
MTTRSEAFASTPRYPIRVAARRGGVSVDVLRAWERRYEAVRPVRTEGEQRLYSDADVHRITLLQRLTAAGHAISALADAGTEELEQLVRVAAASGEDVALTTHPASSVPMAPSRAEFDDLLESCMARTVAHDDEGLARILMRQAMCLTPPAFVNELVAPFSRRLGDAWADQRISEAQERLASGAIRKVLAFLLQALQVDDEHASRRVLVTTLSGERHENGALMAGVIAAYAGCRVTYPGGDLPGAAVAAAARKARADVVGVSVLTGGAARAVARELETLRRELPSRTRLVVGGSSAAQADDAINRASAVRVESLEAWQMMLAAPRRRRTT